MDNVTNRFFRQSLLSYKALFGFLDTKIYVLVKIVNPILQLIFFTLIAKFVHHTNDVSPWVIGNAFMLSVFNSLFGVGTVMVSERRFGTLKLVIASTSNKFLVFTGRAFMHILDGLSSVIIGLTIGYLFFNVHFNETNFLMLGLCILVSMFAAMSLGLLIGSIGLIVSDMNLILNLVMFLLLIFSGAEFSIEKLPVFLQPISFIFPITRGIAASRLIMDGQTSAQVYYLIGMEFIIGCIYLVAGYILLKVLENMARKQATLDVY